MVATRSCLRTSIISVLRRAVFPPPTSSAMSTTPVNGDAANAGAKRSRGTPNGSPAGSALPPKTSSPSLGSRQTSITPLAPLEFLQNQRRGSITDPSLHAGPNPPTFPAGPAASSSISSPFRRPDSPATSFSSSAPRESRRSFSQSRPLSPYKFGDASPQPNESPNANLRRLLRSPSVDTGRRTPTQAMAVDGREGDRVGTAEHRESEGESALRSGQTRGTPRLNVAVRFPLPFMSIPRQGKGQRSNGRRQARGRT